MADSETSRTPELPVTLNRKITRKPEDGRTRREDPLAVSVQSLGRLPNRAPSLHSPHERSGVSGLPLFSPQTIVPFPRLVNIQPRPKCALPHHHAHHPHEHEPSLYFSHEPHGDPTSWMDLALFTLFTRHFILSATDLTGSSRGAVISLYQASHCLQHQPTRPFPC